MGGGMTDNEIIKALECCTTNGASCKDCPAFVEVDRSNCKKYFRGALDLINRIQSQNKDLAETTHNLIIEKDALFDKAEELKAEVERLKEFIVETRRCDKEIKFEARKEFAEKMEERIAVKFFRNKSNKNVEGFVDALDDVNDEMNNLLKEFERKENTTYDG